MKDQGQPGRAGSWALTGAIIAIIVVIIAVVSSCGSSSGGSKTTVTATVVRTNAARPSQSATAVVSFAPTKLARGAQGTVTISRAGKLELSLVITVSVPEYPTYGIALWTDDRHWQGLYTGARGTNTQTLVLGAQTLVRYKFLEVGQEIVRGRVRRGLIRVDSSSITYRNLLRVSTAELLNQLLAARTQ